MMYVAMIGNSFVQVSSVSERINHGNGFEQKELILELDCIGFPDFTIEPKSCHLIDGNGIFKSYRDMSMIEVTSYEMQSDEVVRSEIELATYDF